MMAIIREPTSKFIKVRCSKCKNEQIIFGKVSSRVECLICGSLGKPLAEPTGGKSRVKARILEVLE
jgi:small subunit ribosomal protein S27e